MLENLTGNCQFSIAHGTGPKLINEKTGKVEDKGKVMKMMQIAVLGISGAKSFYNLNDLPITQPTALKAVKLLLIGFLSQQLDFQLELG